MREFNVSDIRWRKLDIKTIVEGAWVEKPDLSRVDEIGFTDLMPGGDSIACSRLDWIEVYGTAGEAVDVARRTRHHRAPAPARAHVRAIPACGWASATIAPSSARAPGRDLLFTTDLLLEDVHFRARHAPAARGAAAKRWRAG